MAEEDAGAPSGTKQQLFFVELTFELNDKRTAVRAQLWLDTQSSTEVLAGVEFDGWDAESGSGHGTSPLEALSGAFSSGDAILDSARASGVSVLRYEHGWGFQPFGTLADEFASVLRDYGPKPDAEIVSGPTPSDSGEVIFRVRVEDREVNVLITIDGLGWRTGDNLDDWSVGSRLVDEFLRDRDEEKLAWCKQAARLRRAAGGPRSYDSPRLPEVTVVGEPISGRHFVELVIGGTGVNHRILFSHRGAVIDDCEHWPSLSEPARMAA
ncbi:MAG TPA: hypothetical protein VHP33_07490, partial [Polyangiaceae bacterium]|nr:hypothetical protein [Polyangiaceae bacterium]